MKLETGKGYYNRLHQKVSIVTHTKNKDRFPYLDSKGNSYTRKGSYRIVEKDDRDLMGEWPPQPSIFRRFLLLLNKSI